MSDDACPDCGHHDDLHDANGCTLPNCGCLTPGEAK